MVKLPPLVRSKSPDKRTNETPDMKHTRNQNHRPVTSMNTRGAVMPGYTGTICDGINESDNFDRVLPQASRHKPGYR